MICWATRRISSERKLHDGHEKVRRDFPWLIVGKFTGRDFSGPVSLVKFLSSFSKKSSFADTLDLISDISFRTSDDKISWKFVMLAKPWINFDSYLLSNLKTAPIAVDTTAASDRLVTAFRGAAGAALEFAFRFNPLAPATKIWDRFRQGRQISRPRNNIQTQSSFLSQSYFAVFQPRKGNKMKTAGFFYF